MATSITNCCLTDADKGDAAHMCKAQHWRHADGVTMPLIFTGSIVPWPFEQLPLCTGGMFGVYLRSETAP